MFTIRPQPRPFIRGWTALIIRKVPVRLMSYHPPPHVRGQLGEGRDREVAGTVDQHVHPPPCRAGQGRQAAAARLVRHVGDRGIQQGRVAEVGSQPVEWPRRRLAGEDGIAVIEEPADE